MIITFSGRLRVPKEGVTLAKKVNLAAGQALLIKIVFKAVEGLLPHGTCGGFGGSPCLPVACHRSRTAYQWSRAVVGARSWALK